MFVSKQTLIQACLRGATCGQRKLICVVGLAQTDLCFKKNSNDTCAWTPNKVSIRSLLRSTVVIFHVPERGSDGQWGILDVICMRKSRQV